MMHTSDVQTIGWTKPHVTTINHHQPSHRFSKTHSWLRTIRISMGFGRFPWDWWGKSMKVWDLCLDTSGTTAPGPGCRFLRAPWASPRVWAPGRPKRRVTGRAHRCLPGETLGFSSRGNDGILWDHQKNMGIMMKFVEMMHGTLMNMDEYPWKTYGIHLIRLCHTWKNKMFHKAISYH